MRSNGVQACFLKPTSEHKGSGTRMSLKPKLNEKKKEKRNWSNILIKEIGVEILPVCFQEIYEHLLLNIRFTLN